MELVKARDVMNVIIETCLASHLDGNGSVFIIKPSSRTLNENGLDDYKIGVAASAVNETELQCIKSVARRFDLSHLWTFNVADRILLIYSPKEA
jgi:hypothetical protein